MSRQQAEQSGKLWARRVGQVCWYLCQHTDGGWFYASPGGLEAALRVTVKAYRFRWEGRKWQKEEV